MKSIKAKGHTLRTIGSRQFVVMKAEKGALWTLQAEIAKDKWGCLNEPCITNLPPILTVAPLWIRVTNHPLQDTVKEEDLARNDDDSSGVESGEDVVFSVPSRTGARP
jgi:hypothetical protein